MGRNRRKQTPKASSKAQAMPKFDVCGVIFAAEHGVTLFTMRCMTPVSSPPRCPEHQAEYLQSIKEYTYWAERGESLANPASISLRVIKGLHSSEEVEQRLKAVVEYGDALYNESMRRKVHLYRFFNTSSGVEHKTRLDVLVRKLEELERVREKLVKRLLELYEANGTIYNTQQSAYEQSAIGRYLATPRYVLPALAHHRYDYAQVYHRPQRSLSILPRYFSSKKVFVLSLAGFALYSTGIAEPLEYPISSVLFCLSALGVVFLL